MSPSGTPDCPTPLWRDKKITTLYKYNEKLINEISILQDDAAVAQPGTART